MRLTFLGTGTSTGVPSLGCHCPTCSSPDPHDKRTRSSLLLEFNGHIVVVDTTPDFRQQGLRERIDRLDAVIFTHTHADHVFGLDDVRVFNMRQKKPIPIYADAHSIEDLRRIFKYVFEGNYQGGGIPQLEPHLIDGPFDLWEERFVPLPVLHGKLPILGFRFRRVAYITDFSAIPEETLPLLEDLDVLILDALRHEPHPTHSTVAESLEWVRRIRPQRALFTHMAHDLAHESTNASLPANTALAYDGLKLEV